jgi:hypothetical protein
MNLDRVEALLVPPLKRLFGRKVQVVAGPVSSPALAGMQSMVFVHARTFLDGDGITREGAHVARRPLTEGRLKGFAEERPGRIVVDVTCLAQAYSTVKDLSGVISPLVLRSLESVTEIPVGALPNSSVRLVFADFAASLAGAEFVRHEEGDLAWHLGRLSFNLDGFLHVTVTNRGGLVKKPKPPPPPRDTLGGRTRTTKKKTMRG